MLYDEYTEKYPNNVIILKESCMTRWNAKMRFLTFYNCYGISAEILHKATGYKLREKSNQKICGGSKLTNVTGALKSSGYSYKVFDGESLIESWEAETESVEMHLIIRTTNQHIAELQKYLDLSGISYDLDRKCKSDGGKDDNQIINHTQKEYAHDKSYRPIFGVEQSSKEEYIRNMHPFDITIPKGQMGKQQDEDAPNVINVFTYHREYKAQDRICDNCMERRNGKCSALRVEAVLCEDYVPAPVCHPEIVKDYPPMGLASWLKQNGKYK